MAVTPAVFFKFGRKAAEGYVARDEVDPLDAIEAAPVPAARNRGEEKAVAGNGADEFAGSGPEHR
jgi:hypothetical protein